MSKKPWSECDLKDYYWLNQDVQYLERAIDVAKRAQIRIRSQYDSEPSLSIVADLTEQQLVINSGRY